MTEQKPTIEGKMKTCGGPGMCPACQSLESTLVETRRALDIARAAYAKAVERYTEVRADSERGDAFIADRNRTVAQLQADLEAEREKVGKLRKAATFARRGCEYNNMFAECEVLDEALSETAPDAKEADHD
jgi:septal ring factor EnvC (AmiA/AmiB activator)